jgi:hypothetical protein
MARNSKAFYVEPTDDGRFKFSRGGASRASGTADTQKDAIDDARDMDPDAAIHAARVRHLGGNHPDQFRKIKGE